MSDGTALYYPHIEFRNPTWLKWALLFWDHGIRRIVPSGYKPLDYSDVRLAVEEDLIIDTDSGRYLKEAAKEFKGHLKSYLSILERAGDLSASADSPTVNQFIDMEGAMQVDKVDPELAELLIGEGLARLSEGRRDNLRGPQPLIALYMTILAERMSTKIKAPLITDRPAYGAIAREIIGGGSVTMDETNRTNILQTLLVPFVKLSSIEKLTMQQILEIRRKHLTSMRRFREEMEKTVLDLTTETDPNAYEDRLSSARSRIKQEVDELMGSLLTTGLAFAHTLLSISGISLLNATVTATGHQLPASVSFGAIGAAATLDSLVFWQKKSEARKKSKYQYVLALGRETR